MNKKHILSYSKFLVEQDVMAGLPMDTPAAPKKEKMYDFIFLDEKHGLKKKRYPDGTVSMDFPVFSVSDSQIKEWTNKNIIADGKENLSDSTAKLRRDNIISIIKGEKLNISNEDVPFLEKLKNAVITDIFGTRRPSVSIVFTKEDEPTTQDVDVTFIKFNS